MPFFSLVIKGVIMSVSQLIPGVSGSTIAIILGIYDRLLEAINHLWKDFRRHANVLFAVCLGAVVGIVLFARGIQWLLEQYPVPLGLFFIGVILGGAPLMYQKSKVESKTATRHWNWVYFLIGFIIVIIMGLEVNSSSPAITEVSWLSAVHLFVGGIVFAIALILPGISGSFMLLVLGLYQTLIVAAADMNVSVLIPIGIGTVAGTFLTARIIEWLLRTYPQPAYLLILGFILGSIFEIFPGWPTGIGQWLVSLFVFAGGFWFVWKTSKE